MDNRFIICCFLFLFSSFCLYAEKIEENEFLSGSDKNEAYRMADSIMRKVIDKAVSYEHLVSEFKAEVYIKGYLEVLKKNILYRFTPSIIPTDRKGRNNIFELVSDLTFSAPNNFVHHFKAVNGNVLPNDKRQAEVINFVNVNIYASTAYNDEILLPVARNALKLYRFSVDSVLFSDGYKMYKIRFEPKQSSPKLMCGYLYILDGLWSVDKIDTNGRLDFAEFNMVMEFGREFNRFFLPQKMDLFLRYRILGNVVESNYTSFYNYKSVRWRDISVPLKKSFDLSKYYAILNDTIPVVRDTAYWSNYRKEPLTPEEKQIYEHVDVKVEKRVDTLRYLELTKKLINSINIDYKSTRMKYSGLFNPFKLGYSGSDGITYKQQFRLSKNFSNDQVIRFRPEIGFVFKRKEVFFKVGGDWLFLPERIGTFSLWAGNGNQGYSSEVTDRVNELLKDSTFKFENLNAKYYKDYFIDIRNSIELFNGFQVGLGLSYHYRTPVKKISEGNIGDEITGLINDTYGDFAPLVNITYTPGQYYKMDGKRKEYVRSYFPTFSFEYARGVPNVWGSKSEYERMELDIQQCIGLGLLRNLSYRVSGGFFSNQKSVYFASFNYFARRNFPESWNDRIGGVFQLLDRNWYNASSSYAQAHVMYESPFILLPLLKKNIATKYVFSERFYLSQLYMPVLPCYTEIGYGFGNHLFNVGAFASFVDGKYNEIGFKFVFELFQ